MSWSSILVRASEENRLLSVLFELTYRCNLDCALCYNDLAFRGTPLEVGTYRRVLSDLAEMGVFQVTLSGGEPLAHPGFFEIGAHARALGFVVRVKSNGHALGGLLARRLRAEVDPFLVEVSLHGARAETHDRQTRVPGSFERLLAHLDDMRAAGLRVKLNSTLTRWNEGEIEEMYALADARGLPLQFDPTVTPRDDGDAAPLSLAASREGYRRLLAIRDSRANRAAPASDTSGPIAAAPPASRHCGAGSVGLTVDPFGNVYPCVQWRAAAGNVNETGIREIWERSRVLAEVREATVTVKATLPSLSLSSVPFCPGLAVQHSGTPTALYPGLPGFG